MVEEEEVSEGSDNDWQEAETFQALHDDECFDSIDDLLRHEKEKHNFDLTAIRQNLQLDMYGSIKLVNYVRKTKALTVEKEDLTDEYLKSTLEDDALLYHLGDEEENEDHKQKYEDLLAQLAEMKKGYKIDDVDPYFDSYDYNEIHETMLKDTIRTDAYRDYIYDQDLSGKTVLDVGCGTGILSMFCAKRGAKVYAVDNSRIIDKARLIAAENKLDINFLQGKVEEITVPKIDLIISEWMGYALLFESMLDSVIHARDTFGGFMAPSKATLHIAGVLEYDRINFWNDVYGFKMTAMKEYDDILIDLVEEVTPDCVFNSFDLNTVTVNDLTFTKPFSIKSDVPIHAFCIWFDITFDKTFSTGPGHQTHWKQAILMLRTPVCGDISGIIEYIRPTNPRHLEIAITTGENRQVWRLC